VIRIADRGAIGRPDGAPAASADAGFARPNKRGW
jgi:hypothetical protein